MTTVQRRWALGGGIASGKSEVRHLLDEQGVPVIDADSIGHSVLEPGGAAFKDVAGRWPKVVEASAINRRLLGEIVFQDRKELAALEAMTHPHIFDEIRRRMEQIRSGTVVVELPFFGRRLGEDWLQMVVDCHTALRVERAVERGLPEDDVRARLAVQPTRSQWLAAADAVIPNHSTISDLRSTIERLIPKL